MKKLLTLLFFSGLFICQAQQMGNPLGYSPKYFSGSFAELRSSHFHSGIDYKTGGVIGKPIFAIEDGYVSRIRVSLGGYGKALYITHPNGKTSVYAHLDSFTGEIDSLTRREQYNKQSFTVSLYPEADNLPIKKGQLIGLSGNTGGSGGPHLHFEIRDTKSQKPVNPFLYGYNPPDKNRPIISGLYYLDIDTKNSIYTPQTPKQIYFEKGSNRAKLKTGGDIGLLVRAYDTITGSSNLCGLYTLQMYVNGELYYEMKVDSVSFDESKMVNLHILYEYFVTNKSRIQKLYIEPENLLSIYTKTGKSGVLTIEPGKFYDIKIVASDFAGNKAVVNLEIIGIQNKQENKLEKENKNYFLFSKNLKNSINIDSFSAEFPQGAFYKNYYMPFKELSDGKYSLGDKRILLAKPYRICIDASKLSAEMQKKAAIVRYDEKDPNEYSFIGGKLDSLSRICASCSSFGIFDLKTDTTAPEVYANNINPSRAMSSSKINMTIKDEQSGIASYNCFIDGSWVLAEYETKLDRLSINLDKEGITKGPHTLQVLITDKRGNVTERKFKFIK